MGAEINEEYVVQLYRNTLSSYWRPEVLNYMLRFPQIKPKGNGTMVLSFLRVPPFERWHGRVFCSFMWRRLNILAKILEVLYEPIPFMCL